MSIKKTKKNKAIKKNKLREYENCWRKREEKRRLRKNPQQKYT